MAEEFHYSVDEYLLLGKVAKAHGLRGEVKVFLHSGQPDNIRSYKELILVNAAGEFYGPLTVLKSRNQGKFAIIQFDSVTSRSHAEQIEGRGILLAKSHLPEVSEDEYYWHQYLGKTVVDLTGTTLGKVDHIFSNGAQDVLVIRAANTEILIPVTKAIIVGETAGELTIDPPPGLVELNTGN